MDDATFRQVVDDVRGQTDLARLVGEEVQLQPSGSVLDDHSPTNKDKDPSLVV